MKIELDITNPRSIPFYIILLLISIGIIINFIDKSEINEKRYLALNTICENQEMKQQCNEVFKDGKVTYNEYQNTYSKYDEIKTTNVESEIIKKYR